MSPKTSASFSANFWRPHVKAWLHCGTKCEFELAVDKSGDVPYHQAELEVLLQPLGDDDLPLGNPVRLAFQRIALRPFPGGQAFWGRTTLPDGIGPPVARRCHFRLRLIPPTSSEQQADEIKRKPENGSTTSPPNSQTTNGKS